MDVILDYTFFYSFSIKFLDFGNFGMKCFGAVGRSHNKLTKGLIFFFCKGLYVWSLCYFRDNQIH